jgi:hypothetical protein
MQSHTIQDFQFGSMIVDGRVYTQDLILLPDRIQSNWWRKEGHLLQAADLQPVFDAGPALLIVGTGVHGIMKIADETSQKLQASGIELRAAPTPDAWKLYNSLCTETRLAGAFHLTC